MKRRLTRIWENIKVYSAVTCGALVVLFVVAIPIMYYGTIIAVAWHFIQKFW